VEPQARFERRHVVFVDDEPIVHSYDGRIRAEPDGLLEHQPSERAFGDLMPQTQGDALCVATLKRVPVVG